MEVSNVSIEENKPNSRLTVTADGKVRIKIATGASLERRDRLVQQLYLVARKILDPGIKLTMRGVAEDNSIRMSFGGSPRARKKHKHKTITYWFTDIK